MKTANIDMVHVPYRGNGPMLQALLQNDVQLTFDTPTLASPHIADGKLAALAVTGERRMAKLPDVPTVQGTGIDYSTDVRIFVHRAEGDSEPLAALSEQGVHHGAGQQGRARPPDRLRARGDAGTATTRRRI